MKLLDRYILAKTLWPLIATVSIALIALLMEQTVRLLDLVVNKGGPLSLILRMLANLIPHYLGIALPAAFFIGVLLAVSRLSSESELDAMHASGVPLHRMIAPLMVFAVLLVIFAAIIVGFLQPYTRYGYRALIYLVTETAWYSALEKGAFFSGFGNSTILVDDISEGGRRLTGIFVYEDKSNGGSITTTAQTGYVVRSLIDDQLVLKLEQGARIDTDGPNKKINALTFSQSEVPLDIALAPEPYRIRGASEREQTLPELWHNVWTLPKTDPMYYAVHAELHERFVRIATYLFLPLLAVPLGSSTRRTRRGTGIAVGIILIVIFYYLLQFGHDVSANGRLSPWLSLWLPFFVYAGFSSWAFWEANVSPGHNFVETVLARIESIFDNLRQMGRRRKVPA
jgi:lipopolysaccharide export system permease protein